MSDLDAEKRSAANAAAELVETGMTVGLGSGSTASLVISRLGERVRAEGLKFNGVATSVGTSDLARACGITIVDIDSIDMLDLGLDGADEVDPEFRLIKGRGGALLREKIVATAAKRRVTVVTLDKRVNRLGQRFPVPVEVSAFGIKHTEHALRNLGAVPSLRCGADGKAAITDEGHRILDCRFAAIEDPEGLDQRLRRIVGVFETGLFVGLCDLLIVGSRGGAERIEAPPRRAASRST